MSKKILIGIAIVALLAVAGFAYSVLRPTAKASAPIEAVPVDVEESQPEAMPETETESQDTGETMAEENGDDALAEESEMDDGDSGEEAEMSSDTADEMPASEGMIIFTIAQEESQARFSLDELLRGEPTTVVGVTDQVAGEIAINVENPANSKVGTIQVNARTLVTDNDFRNRAINNKILETGEYEFITFIPTGLVDFPENPQIGQELSFKIVGDLTIRDITNEVTFDAKVTVVSEERIEGYASTMVALLDYELEIPEVPSVADVDEEVLIEIEFIAFAK